MMFLFRLSIYWFYKKYKEFTVCILYIIVFQFHIEGSFIFVKIKSYFSLFDTYIMYKDVRAIHCAKLNSWIPFSLDNWKSFSCNKKWLMFNLFETQKISLSFWLLYVNLLPLPCCNWTEHAFHSSPFHPLFSRSVSHPPLLFYAHFIFLNNRKTKCVLALKVMQKWMKPLPIRFLNFICICEAFLVSKAWQTLRILKIAVVSCK